MPPGLDQLSSRSVTGAASGAAAGMALGLFELVGAGFAGAPSALLTARIVLIDVLLGLAVGFVAGVLSAPVPPGQGPVARGAAFLARGPGGRRVRATAVTVGAAVFVHGSMALGEAVAGQLFEFADVVVELLGGLEGGLFDGAGELQLAAGLQRDGRAVFDERDDLAAIEGGFPAVFFFELGEDVGEPAGLIEGEHLEGLSVKDELFVFSAKAEGFGGVFFAGAKIL